MISKKTDIHLFGLANSLRKSQLSRLQENERKQKGLPSTSLITELLGEGEQGLMFISDSEVFANEEAEKIASNRLIADLLNGAEEGLCFISKSDIFDVKAEDGEWRLAIAEYWKHMNELILLEMEVFGSLVNVHRCGCGVEHRFRHQAAVNFV